MFDTFVGLPLHALVLHATVVLVPLMAVLTVLVAVRPSWRVRGAWPVVVGNAVTTGAVFVTQQSGERLEARLGQTPLIRAHAAMGDLMLWFMLALLAASVLMALARTRRGAVGAVVGALSVVAAVAATVWVVRTGHSGSVAVWRDVIRSTTSGR